MREDQRHQDLFHLRRVRMKEVQRKRAPAAPTEGCETSPVRKRPEQRASGEQNQSRRVAAGTLKQQQDNGSAESNFPSWKREFSEDERPRFGSERQPDSFARQDETEAQLNSAHDRQGEEPGQGRDQVRKSNQGQQDSHQQSGRRNRGRRKLEGERNGGYRFEGLDRNRNLEVSAGKNVGETRGEKDRRGVHVIERNQSDGYGKKNPNVAEGSGHLPPRQGQAERTFFNGCDSVHEVSGSRWQVSGFPHSGAAIGRRIMTSVALMSAAAVSPTFRPRSRAASRVMMAVTLCPPISRETLVRRPTVLT